jgi:aryl-alcohol dehydrogenase-like predicted oxidoreductase
VEYLDLYFCHRPDQETPIQETVWAMNDLIRQGKVLYWGTSEWSAQQITEAHQVASEYRLIGPTMEQPQYNLFHREKVEKEFAPLYGNYGLGLTIWSPLASGILTGKYSNGIPKDSRMSLPGYEFLRKRMESAEGREQIEKTKKLAGLADQLGISTATLALAWCAKNPHVSTVILGASKKAQLEENLKAVGAIRLLTDSVLQQIETIVQNKPEAAEDFK